jgi:hypothetical protein
MECGRVRPENERRIIHTREKWSAGLERPLRPETTNRQ